MEPNNLPVADEKPTVATPGAQRVAMEDDLVTVMDLWGGTKSMRKASMRHLPKEPAETTGQYNNRLLRSTFFNGFKRSVKNLVGKPFSKPVKIAETIDKKLQALMDDVDRTGRHIDVFAVDLMETGIRDGLVFVVVDYPDMTSITNAADEQAAKPRPYWIKVDARNLIGVKYTVVNGEYQILQVRIVEHVTVPNGVWGEKSIKQVRVMEPGTWEVWRQKQDHSDGVAEVTTSQAEAEEWAPFSNGTNSIQDTVPIFCYYTQRTEFFQAEPPLMDLVYLNIEHWQSSSDQRNILHVARVPILFGKGWQDVDPTGAEKSIVIGAGTIVTQASEHADLKYVEHNGKGIDAGRTDIQDIENRMAVMGTQVLVKHAPEPGGKTATQTVADTEADYCDLAVMTRLLEDTLEQCIAMMGRYMKINVPDGRFVTINKDFGISQRDAADAQFLLSARSANEITQETFLDELQRRGILDPTLDIGDEILKLSLQAPSIGQAPGTVFGSPTSGGPNDQAAGEATPVPGATLHGAAQSAVSAAAADQQRAAQAAHDAAHPPPAGAK